MTITLSLFKDGICISTTLVEFPKNATTTDILRECEKIRYWNMADSFSYTQ